MASSAMMWERARTRRPPRRTPIWVRLAGQVRAGPPVIARARFLLRLLCRHSGSSTSWVLRTGLCEYLRPPIHMIATCPYALVKSRPIAHCKVRCGRFRGLRHGRLIPNQLSYVGILDVQPAV